MEGISSRQVLGKRTRITTGKSGAHMLEALLARSPVILCAECARPLLDVQCYPVSLASVSERNNMPRHS
jgi:hypothetical protein